jgi:hypothetical protein
LLDPPGQPQHAFYFFGSYGLGALSYWASVGRHSMRRLAFLSALVVLALLIDFRVRVAAAGVLMLMLGLGKKYGVLESLPVPGFLTYLGRISYSVFLVHFPLCLVVNAIFSHYFPHRALINAFGVVIAFASASSAAPCFSSGLRVGTSETESAGCYRRDFSQPGCWQRYKAAETERRLHCHLTPPFINYRAAVVPFAAPAGAPPCDP